MVTDPSDQVRASCLGWQPNPERVSLEVSVVLRRPRGGSRSRRPGAVPGRANRSRLVILQAAGLALLAALSPTTLLVSAVYLGSARPRLVGAAYLAGAIIMSLVMGLVVIAILRNTGLQHHSQRAPRYGLRLGLRLLMLAAGGCPPPRRPTHRARPPARAETETAQSRQPQAGARLKDDRRSRPWQRVCRRPAPVRAWHHVHRRGPGDRHGQCQHRAHHGGHPRRRVG